jgi:hypothetical protein
MLAEFVVLEEEGVVKNPAHLSLEESATLPCAGVTAWNALVEHGKLIAGRTVLLQGTGGVSTFGLQLAHAMGLRVVITSSSDEKRIAHGLYTASPISALLGTRLPGPGAIYISQTLNFRAPVRIGDKVVVTVTVAELVPERSRTRLTCACRVGDDIVLDGEALVKVPSRAKMRLPKMEAGGRFTRAI